MTDKPICYDLYAGLGGWTEGFLSEGYHCIGFDIEAHDYGTGGYPGELRIRDIRSIHGSELKDATCIVGSSPCQEFSYRAMPWKRAKALPPPYLGIKLFNAQFRIQREASEAAGHYIPMVVENVRGAQKWVGQARYHYGSFYLWGDVPALMPSTFNVRTSKTPPGNGAGAPLWKDRKLNSLSHATMTDDSREWYGFEEGSLKSHNRLVANTGVKQAGISGPRNNGKGDAWFQDGAAQHGSKSNARKAASALIAKIPFALSSHIARCFKPIDTSADEKAS